MHNFHGYTAAQVSPQHCECYGCVGKHVASPRDDQHTLLVAAALVKLLLHVPAADEAAARAGGGVECVCAAGWDAQRGVVCVLLGHTKGECWVCVLSGTVRWPAGRQ